MCRTRGMVETVVFRNTFVRAITWFGADHQHAHVYKSVLLQDTDEPVLSVYEFLSGFCYRIDRVDEVDDDGMMFGRAISTNYTLWVNCPAQTADHFCKIRRRYGG